MRHFAQLVTLQLLRAYKWAVSPLFPPACRYVPTCSEYAMEAVERYGALRGTWMALGRLLRCHPFAHGGYDPVVSKAQDPAPPLALGFGASLHGVQEPKFMQADDYIGPSRTGRSQDDNADLWAPISGTTH